MDPTFPRPMLNSPVREGTADAELFVERVVARLDAAHEANLAVPVVSNWDQRASELEELRKDSNQLSATCASWIV
jgi:hypothetical protein